MKAEALLYIWSDGLKIKEIQKALNCTSIELNKIENMLLEKYGNDSGIQYIISGDTRSLNTNPLCYETISNLLGQDKEKSLSSQAMEVLAIIAYKQPTTRLDVEKIRGVQSSGIFDTLKNRGLIEIAGRLDSIGQPYIYKTTDKFLKHFSLESLADLPQMPKLENIYENQ